MVEEGSREPGHEPSSRPEAEQRDPANGARRVLSDAVARVRAWGHRRPRRATAAAAGVLAIWIAVVTAVDRAFSVSCVPSAPCVTFDDLRRGAALPEAMRIYDRNGEIIAEVAGPLRRTLTYDEIPELVREAFVAVEDRRFWEHDGVDGRGVLRAAFRNLAERDISEGASTIAMQLVRTVWAESLRDVGPWRRKIIEARTAPRLVAELGHEAVLTHYLNAIYLGNGLYGVERASREYFGVGVEDLDVGQVALLVGMTRSPEFYEPRRYPDRARSVRDVVLGVLGQEGLIDMERAVDASRRAPVVAPADSSGARLGGRSHVTAAITRELRRVAPELAGRPGIGVFTTLDPTVQASGERAVLQQLERIEDGAFGRFRATEGARLEAAGVSIEPSTGAVLAWIGGRDFGASEFDRVDQARRQVGSLVKPFLVATALEEGYGIVDLISADTVPIETEAGPWLPADHVSETRLPLREALVRSSNRAAARLGVGLGLETIGSIGARVGLEGPIPSLPSSSIGAFEASLLELTTAYATLGNGGLGLEPYLIERVEGPTGAELWTRESDPTPTRVISEAHAFVVLDALRAVVDRGTGSSVRTVGYRGPAAGKTGTTNGGRDAWFVGLTPDLASGVWVGFDRPAEIVPGAGGGSLAAPAWGAWMQEIHRSERPRVGAWIPPTGVERVWYDGETGEAFSLRCGREAVSRGYHEAWVQAGMYTVDRCEGGVSGWLGRLWRAVVGEGRPPDRPR